MAMTHAHGIPWSYHVPHHPEAVGLVDSGMGIQRLGPNISAVGSWTRFSRRLAML